MRIGSGCTTVLTPEWKSDKNELDPGPAPPRRGLVACSTVRSVRLSKKALLTCRWCSLAPSPQPPVTMGRGEVPSRPRRPTATGAWWCALALLLFGWRAPTQRRIAWAWQDWTLGPNAGVDLPLERHGHTMNTWRFTTPTGEIKNRVILFGGRSNDISKFHDPQKYAVGEQDGIFNVLDGGYVFRRVFFVVA